MSREQGRENIRQVDLEVLEKTADLCSRAGKSTVRLDELCRHLGYSYQKIFSSLQALERIGRVEEVQSGEKSRWKPVGQGGVVSDV